MTAGNGGRRSQREETAIAALLSEPTIAKAATRAGISESTLLRWLQDPEFKAKHRAARRSIVEGAIGRLQQATTDAVATLQRNLTCGLPAVEVGAARSILDQAIKAVELVDLAERVEILEQASELAAARDGGKRR